MPTHVKKNKESQQDTVTATKDFPNILPSPSTLFPWLPPSSSGEQPAVVKKKKKSKPDKAAAAPDKVKKKPLKASDMMRVLSFSLEPIVPSSKRWEVKTPEDFEKEAASNKENLSEKKNAADPVTFKAK